MSRRVDTEAAQQVLESGFNEAAEDFRRRKPPDAPEAVEQAFDRLFASATQAYREALLGCIVVRLVDNLIDIRYPHTKQSDSAFSGRSLDEQVINPFLLGHEIPCSRGPYLSALRRAVSLELPVPKGQRDQEAFTQMVRLVDMLREGDESIAQLFLRYILYMFMLLREESNIDLVRIHRLSIEQYKRLLCRLLSTPSGGRFPMLVVISVFQAIERSFELGWEIEWQKINAPDAPSQARGDVTIRRNGDVLLAIEVTERPIDDARVRATFRAKISPHSIDDYLFFFTATPPNDDARQAAKQYFAQGHHIGFLSVEEWAFNILGTIGPEGRAHFNDIVLGLLSRNDVPKELKVAWNRHLEAVVTE